MMRADFAGITKDEKEPANGVRPESEIKYLRRLWTAGRPMMAIFEEMTALEWSPADIDHHLGKVAGHLPVRASQVLGENF